MVGSWLGPEALTTELNEKNKQLRNLKSTNFELNANLYESDWELRLRSSSLQPPLIWVKCNRPAA